ncbi:hypothetical protein CCR85_05420 [Rhodothalassium salexigens]|nr:hypothetical protein [Rhodothalassium salexigens]
MTPVLITIDTELSNSLHKQGLAARANLDSSIHGRCRAGAFGIGWQMDQLDRYGLTGVFFVDPMPALVHGRFVVEEIIETIVARGHEVQLHIHTEWLAAATTSPVGDRRGTNIGDFHVDDQTALVDAARRLLVDAGAPAPTAFRAGNYGADDNTLRALHSLGIVYDSSFNAAYATSTSRIGLDPAHVGPVRRHGVIELPVSDLFDRPGHVRPAQVCALSMWEMDAALNRAKSSEAPFVIVTHSFEMLSRDRERPNHSLMRRFKALCRRIAHDPGLTSAGFDDLVPDRVLATQGSAQRLPANPLRTGARLAKQAVDTVVYERSLGRVP